jgi:hypothetical protein
MVGGDCLSSRGDPLFIHLSGHGPGLFTRYLLTSIKPVNGTLYTNRESDTSRSSGDPRWHPLPAYLREAAGRGKGGRVVLILECALPVRQVSLDQARPLGCLVEKLSEASDRPDILKLLRGCVHPLPRETVQVPRGLVVIAPE